MFQKLMALEASRYWESRATDETLGTKPAPLIPRSAFRGRKELSNWLQFQGFGIGKADHWLIMGLSRKASKGQPQVIERRIQQAVRIIALGMELAAGDSLRSCEAETLGALSEAARKCTEDLQKPAPERSGALTWCTDYGALGEEGVEMLRRAIGPEALI